MILFFYDKEGASVASLDQFTSLIWTERYRSCGDFEVVFPYDQEYYNAIVQGGYARMSESEYPMVVETIEINSDNQNGLMMTVSGRSVESILSYRVLYPKITVSGELVDAYSSLMNHCFGNIWELADKGYRNRYTKNVIFAYNASGRNLPNIDIGQRQYTGDNLYDVTVSMAEELDFGFKMKMSYESMPWEFYVTLYRGKDRSAGQYQYDTVYFSHANDNLDSTKYIDSIRNYANMAIVAGEDTGSDRKFGFTSLEWSAKGTDRREIYVDARDIQSEGLDIPDDPADPTGTLYYQGLLTSRGEEKLSENKHTKQLEASIIDTLEYVYPKDYSLGDLVQVVTEYGISLKARITEYIFSENANGIRKYPSFEIIQED